MEPHHIKFNMYTCRIKKNESQHVNDNYDSRDMSKPPAQWVDREILGEEGGTPMRGHSIGPAALVLDPLRPEHAGEFRCRVDYRAAPTRNSRILVTVIVPPQKPSIFDDRGREVQFDRAGPYPEGTDLRLTCIVTGGTPLPTVEWWRDDILLDSSDTSSAYPMVKANQLIIQNLQRYNRGATYVCKASNTNLIPPVSSSVTIDMYLRPTSLNIISDNMPLSAGRRHEMNCEVMGSDPPPKVEWWLGDMELVDFTQKDLDGGNFTISTVYFTPKRDDDGKMLTCRARNIHIEEERMETSIQIDVNYSPKLKLYLGSSLNPDDIEEGDDVYFECKVNSNPAAYKVLWKHNNEIIQHNQKNGIITSSSHLALQNVVKGQAGNYSCLASNVEGDGQSNNVDLKVMYKPLCRSDQKRLYGLARGERTMVDCSVDSYPPPKSFRWAFNNTAETRELQEPHVEERNGQYTSMLNYTPVNEMDYGTLLCWASNLAGKQMDPCVFHVIPGGKPDPPYNCTLLNQTTESLDIDCIGGFDGGQAQNFILEVYDQKTGALQANMSSPMSHFIVNGLRPGRSLIMAIYAANTRGRSESAMLEGFTLKKAEKQTGQENNLEIKPLIIIFVGITVSILIITIATMIILKLHVKPHSSNEPLQPTMKDKRDPPLSSETESIYGDKNPDVIRFNKGTFHREPGFPESDYQLGGSTGEQLTENEWPLPQLATTPGMQCNAAHSPSVSHGSRLPHTQRICTNNVVDELPFDDYPMTPQMNYLLDPQNINTGLSSPSYGRMDFMTRNMNFTMPIKPVREIVTVRTPLMLNNQQESCV
ncbi:contactin-3-like [Arctopsyche grandis]|uniref:contactin-3-like n=1 Tax=Arctopsyche grandis TaxID=121162 RepID=UPI00406D6A1C